MWSPFFDPIIARYARERLGTESKAARGSLTEISRATGLSKTHLSNLIEGARGLSDDVAATLCKYWGIKQGDLCQIAHDTYGSTGLVDSQPKTHPELEITLQFCRSIYPEPFLQEYELAARRQPDRAKLYWFLDLHAKFRAWYANLPPAAQRKFSHFAGLPMPFTEEQEPVSLVRSGRAQGGSK